MARQSVHQDIAQSVDRTLRDEARRAELMLATVRTLALFLVTCLNTVMYVAPGMAGWAHLSGWLPVFTAGWCALAAALAVALRRGFYGTWMRTVVPAADGALIYATFALAWDQAAGGDDELRHGLLVVWTVTAGLLAASGGLRLTRGSTVWTTCVAVLVLVLVLAGATHALWVVYAVSMLVCIGALAMWMTQIVRRATRSEVSRITLARFLPDRVIEAAREDPLALLTDPRSVDATILVSDLRGFTSLAETLSPAEALALLNEIQGAFARAVRGEGGTVDKFLGDGMLAVFGAPEPIDDHAARAVEAAVLMRRALEATNLGRASRGEPPLKMGVGIHSGPVVVGCLGSGAYLEFTVIGDTVNTASRLEGVTKEKGVDVIVSEETAVRVAEQAGTEELSTLQRLGEDPHSGAQGAAHRASLARSLGTCRAHSPPFARWRSSRVGYP